MTKHVKDITGKKFGFIKIIEFDSIRGKSKHSYWKGVCVCGKEVICRGSHLRLGQIKSCGCKDRARASRWLKRYASSDAHKGKGNPMYKHGDSKTLFFIKFQSIKQRCNDKNNPAYKTYGGRGIKFLWNSYEEFKKDMYKSFLKHSKIHGTRNTTIERIDVNGNYCKENCRWATVQEQALNRRTNHLITYEGITMSLVEWEKKLKFPYNLISKRIQIGFTDIQAIKTPYKSRYRMS